MATHCGMGVTAFSKYCRELTNSGPVEYLNHCRLDHAARQLKACPSVPVTEIAFGHGFNSSQYFATVFRRRFHATPRKFRNATSSRVPARTASSSVAVTTAHGVVDLEPGETPTARSRSLEVRG